MGDDTQRPESKDRTPYQTVLEWVQKAGAILARWWEQPIGIFVPLIALLILLFAPQSADMFAGMVGPWSAVGFASAAAFLALSSWYWTRAALLAPDGTDDTSWIAGYASRQKKGKKLPAKWSDEWAPRIGVLFAGVIAATPLIAAIPPIAVIPLIVAIPLILLILGKLFQKIGLRHRLLTYALAILAVIVVGGLVFVLGNDFSSPLPASALAVLAVIVVNGFVVVRGSILSKVRRFLGLPSKPLAKAVRRAGCGHGSPPR